ncbi:hypothetical protein TWF506_005839 [Arthrobotrys conoides]|uniref:Uncharacterized protein n=1 Tax=Arthrobotrys conoides TaxID=74498 RepID=A0AAN8NUV4_9PEZI
MEQTFINDGFFTSVNCVFNIVLPFLTLVVYGVLAYRLLLALTIHPMSQLRDQANVATLQLMMSRGNAVLYVTDIALCAILITKLYLPEGIRSISLVLVITYIRVRDSMDPDFRPRMMWVVWTGVYCALGLASMQIVDAIKAMDWLKVPAVSATISTALPL